MTQINLAGLVALLKSDNGHVTTYRDAFAAVLAMNATIHRSAEISAELDAHTPCGCPSIDAQIDGANIHLEEEAYQTFRELFFDASNDYDALGWPEGVAEDWEGAEDQELEELFIEVRSKIPAEAYGSADALMMCVRHVLRSEIKYLKTPA